MKQPKPKKERDWKSIGAVCLIGLLVMRALAEKKTRSQVVNDVVLPAVKKTSVDIVSDIVRISMGVDPVDTRIVRIK